MTGFAPLAELYFDHFNGIMGGHFCKFFLSKNDLLSIATRPNQPVPNCQDYNRPHVLSDKG